MSYLLNALKAKENELIKYLEQLPQNEEMVGSLRIRNRDGRLEYFWRKNGRKDDGEYIRAADQHIARALAQKSYNRNLRRKVEEQLSEIRRMIASYHPDDIDACYNNLRPERQALITPIIEPIESFTKKWEESHPDQQNPYPNTTDLYSDRGEHVRSKSEMIIANKLNTLGIPYRYEAALVLPGVGTIYPDFTILNRRTRKEIIWEHEGRMDDPNYSSAAVIRLENYEKNGYWPGRQLIFTCETKDHTMNMRLLAEIVEKYLI